MSLKGGFGEPIKSKVSVFITSSYQVGERRVNVISALLMSVWPSASTAAINELYLICI